MDQIQRMTKERVAGAAAVSGATGPKSPGAAWAWSFFFPGAGQIYNGNTARGVTQLALYYGSLIVATSSLEECYYYYDYDDCEGNAEVAAGFLLASVGIWIWAQIDAYQSAKAINAAYGLQAGLIEPRLQYKPSPYGPRKASLEMTLLRFKFH